MGHSNLQGCLSDFGSILLVYTFSVWKQRKISFKQDQTNHKPQSEVNGGGQVTLTFSPPWDFEDAAPSAKDFL